MGAVRENTMTDYEAWLRRRMAETGLDAEELLRRDLEAVAKSPYPGPACLYPSDLDVAPADLPAEARAHLETCPMCAALRAAGRGEFGIADGG
jgi:hypothetical protein